MLPDTARQARLGLLLVLIGVQVASAGTVLVPFAADGAAGGLVYDTSVAVTNPTTEVLFVSLDFRPGVVDGVAIEQDLEPVVESIGPGETRYFSGLSQGLDTLGLLEVTGDDALVVDVRVRVVDAQGRGELVQAPVLASDGLAPGGATIVITGYYRDDNRRMTLGLANGSVAENPCEVQFEGREGQALSVPISLTLPPRTLAYWSDALGAAGVAQVAEGRFQMTCEQPAYAFSLFVDVDTGEVVRRDPSIALASSLIASEEANLGGPSDEQGTAVVETGPGLVRLRVDGVVHAPERGRSAPVWLHELDLPGLSTIESITASVVVETGTWGSQRDRPQHHLLQISKDRWGDGGWDFWIRPDREEGLTLRGLLASRGRGEGNEVARDTEVGRPDLYPVNIEQQGNAVRGEGLALSSGVQLPRSGPLFVQLGARLGESNDPKVPSWGWVWRDLLIEVRGR